MIKPFSGLSGGHSNHLLFYFLYSGFSKNEVFISFDFMTYLWLTNTHTLRIESQIPQQCFLKVFHPLKLRENSAFNAEILIYILRSLDQALEAPQSNVFSSQGKIPNSQVNVDPIYCVC